MARICFLFNHDQVHQVAHSLPIALKLAAEGSAEVTLAATSDKIESHLRQTAGDALTLCRLVRLDVQAASSKFVVKALDGIVPARKIAIYRDNLDFFRGFDALVVSEKTSLLLKTRYGLHDLKIVHTRHGAGDRAIGFGRQSAHFDLVLVSGPKIARRLIAEAGVAPERIAIVGYSKFDLYADRRAVSPFPDPTKPVVLYNPHPSPRLSSWHRMGASVLEAFYESGRYNLVFAPHVMMFARDWTITVAPPAITRMRQPPAHYSDVPHMLVDLGSAASTDMTYTNLADVYIGDVSSQVYEFLHRPRPCLHLNAHNVKWQGDPDYAHWQSGPVVGPDADIIDGVDRAIATHGDYLATQRELLNDTFSVTAEPATDRAARAIAAFAQGGSFA